MLKKITILKHILLRVSYISCRRHHNLTPKTSIMLKQKLWAGRGGSHLQSQLLWRLRLEGSQFEPAQAKS
jgi:hypothetical protein